MKHQSPLSPCAKYHRVTAQCFSGNQPEGKGGRCGQSRGVHAWMNARCPRLPGREEHGAGGGRQSIWNFTSPRLSPPHAEGNTGLRPRQPSSDSVTVSAEQSACWRRIRVVFQVPFCLKSGSCTLWSGEPSGPGWQPCEKVAEAGSPRRRKLQSGFRCPGAVSSYSNPNLEREPSRPRCQ